MTKLIQRITQADDLNIKNTTTVEIVLPELDATKSVTRNCHADDVQIIHKNDNITETVFYPKV